MISVRYSYHSAGRRKSTNRLCVKSGRFVSLGHLPSEQSIKPTLRIPGDVARESAMQPTRFNGSSRPECMVAPANRPTSGADGRVEMWRGGCRSNISVAAPFAWRCLTGSAMGPFLHSAHRGTMPHD
jgi:hypothetical protein